MARSRKLRKRENRPRRKTNKRGKKAQRAKTHKKTARRARVKAHRPRRHARVTRRRVHRKRGGKPATHSVAGHAADYRTAYNGKSITHHGKNIARIKPLVDMSLGDLHGRTPGTTGSSTSGGPKIVKPGSVATPDEIRQALNDVFPGSSSASAKTGKTLGKIAGSVLGGLTLEEILRRYITAPAPKAVVKAPEGGVVKAPEGGVFKAPENTVQRVMKENLTSDVSVQPKQYIVEVEKSGKTYFQTFTNKEAALAAKSGDTSVETVPEKVSLNLKTLGKRGFGADRTFTFVENPETGVLESTDPAKLAQAIRGMETLDSVTAGTANDNFDAALTFLRSVAKGNIKAGSSEQLLNVLQEAGISTDGARALQGAIQGIDDATQQAVATSDSLQGALDNPFKPVSDSLLGDALKGLEDGGE